MKKYIPLLIITSLLLSACGIVDGSNFELQEKCAKHSEKLFTEKGYNFEKGTLSNYYNKKLDICFALFESSDFSNWVSLQKEFYNALTRRSYGFYLGLSQEWKMNTVQCDFTNPENNTITSCLDGNKFLELAKPFLEK